MIIFYANIFRFLFRSFFACFKSSMAAFITFTALPLPKSVPETPISGVCSWPLLVGYLKNKKVYNFLELTFVIDALAYLKLKP